MGLEGKFDDFLTQETKTLNSLRKEDHANIIERTIITAQEGKRIIQVHQSLDKIVTIGRSKQNNICLSNPHFPRKAAEIMLGPIPVLRITGKSKEKSHNIVPIETGKIFKILPYSFCILKPGDILINHAGNPFISNKLPRRSFSLITVSILAIFLLKSNHKTATTDVYTPHENVNIEKEIVETTNSHAENNKDHMDWKPLSILADPISHLKVEVQGEDKIQKPIKRRKERLDKINDGKKGKPVNSLDIVSLEVKGIPSQEFKTIINAADRLINLGDLEQAGRTIKPILPYLSLEQKSDLVQSLNPSLHSLYQRAYMLSEYDKPTSITILEKIVSSDLLLLPSFKKARIILESERKIENSIRSTGKLGNKL